MRSILRTIGEQDSLEFLSRARTFSVIATGLETLPDLAITDVTITKLVILLETTVDMPALLIDMSLTFTFNNSEVRKKQNKKRNGSCVL